MNEQYNGITPGNEMKPNAVMDSDKIDAVPLEDAKAQGLYIPEGYDKQADNSATYNVTETVDGKDTIVKKTGVVVPKLKFDTIDKILTECHAKGLKLRGVFCKECDGAYFEERFGTCRWRQEQMRSLCL